jgi:hypothetical protein
MRDLRLDCSSCGAAEPLTRLLLVGGMFLALGWMGCGEDAGSGGSGGAGGSGATGGSGGTAGTGLECDDGTVADVNSSQCSACLECAAAGPCAGDIAACDNSADCVTFTGCLNDCSGSGDLDACTQNCVDTTPEQAVVLFQAAQDCSFCQECPANCQVGGLACEVTGGTCDDGMPGDPDSGKCTACIDCATGASCSDSVSACFDSSGCAEYATCVEACWDPPSDFPALEACLGTCIGEISVDDQNLFLNAINCVYCDECVTNCGAASACQ